MRNQSIFKIALATCLLNAGAAMADVFSTASLSDLRIVLADTRPDDGIAPGVTFSSGATLSSVDGNEWQHQAQSASPFDALFYANATPDASSLASISQDPSSGNRAIKAFSYATQGNPNQVLTSIDAGYSKNCTFTVQPGTAMFILGVADVGIVMTQQSSNGNEYADVYVLMTLQGPLIDGQTSFSSTSFYQSYYPGDANVFEQSGLLQLSFLNNTDAAETGAFSMRVSASATSLPSVPEPGVPALMLGGLGAIGWRLRRKPQGDCITPQ